MYLYIDTSHMANMLAHSMRPEELSGGAPQLALNVVNMVANFIRHYNATRAYFCMDSEQGTWRSKVHPGYKAQRPEKLRKDPHQKAMKDLADQACRLLPELIRLLETPVFAMPWVEADDCCAAVVHLNHHKPGMIITADKDYWQMLSPTIGLLNPAHNYRIKLDESGRLVKNKANGDVEEIGLTPSQYLVQRAMVGDSSDNLEGLVGCGEKTATTVIKENRVQAYLSEQTGIVKRRKTKSRPAENVNQDARAIIKRNLEMMSLFRSKVFEKVRLIMSGIEKEGVRPPRNSATRLGMWLESKGYNNPQMVQRLVSIYTDLWTQ